MLTLLATLLLRKLKCSYNGERTGTTGNQPYYYSVGIAASAMHITEELRLKMEPCIHLQLAHQMNDGALI